MSYPTLFCGSFCLLDLGCFPVAVGMGAVRGLPILSAWNYVGWDGVGLKKHVGNSISTVCRTQRRFMPKFSFWLIFLFPRIFNRKHFIAKKQFFHRKQFAFVA